MVNSTWVAAGCTAGVLYLAFVLNKIRHPPRKYRLQTVTPHGALRYINVIFEFIRAALGISLFNVKRKQFIEEAKRIAANTDEKIFGPQEEYIKGVTLFVNGVPQNQMSASGIILLNGFLERVVKTRKYGIEYIQSHPECLESKLDRPIIISGLPRTGSTMLYNLLSCDPDARTPRFFEQSQMANPTPPVTEETRDTDPRIQWVTDRFDETERIFPGMWTEAGKSHRSHPNEIEEDLLVLFHSFLLQLHVPIADKKYRDWYEEENKDFAYIYHQAFFRMMNHAWTPRSHWVLKAPIHSTYLPSLMKYYPDARLVFTHREPLAVMPSWARFLEEFLHWSYLPNTLDRIKFGRYILESLVLCGDREIAFKKTLRDEQYFDVDYVTMTKDPIGMVVKLYNHFGLTASEQFKENMAAWIKDNRQGKYGRREYALEDYNLTENDINREFERYNVAFFPPKK